MPDVAPEFVHDVPASRVVFGAGRRRTVAEELGRLDVRRVLLVARPSRPEVAELVADLGPLLAGHVTEVAMHVPADVAGRAVAAAGTAEADVVVALGGGSAIGTAKAVALETDLPILAVPTTYAGSEMTPIWGLTRDGHKVTGRDPRVRPAVVVYDPELTLSLPARLTADSGMNALAHLVEGLYAPGASPLTLATATAGVRALAGGLPRVVVEPADLAARSDVLVGAWLAGWVLGTAGMGVHHKICHVLGGSVGLPHAETHAAVLPAVVAANAAAAPEAMAALATALREAGRAGEHPAGALWDLRHEIGATEDLAALGLTADRVPEVVDEVLAAPPVNPRPLDSSWLRDVLLTALTGERPVPSTTAPD